jgi:hypothetical protein
MNILEKVWNLYHFGLDLIVLVNEIDAVSVNWLASVKNYKWTIHLPVYCNFVMQD